MIPQQVMKQRNLMRRALRYLDDMETIKRSFDSEDVLINLKLENLQSSYAHTMTELTQLMMSSTDQEDYIEKQPS